MDALAPQLMQFAGSLVAILALAWVARRLGLGPGPRLGGEEEVRHALDAAVPGFNPIALAVDRGGSGAIARDRSGRVLVLRPHGSHFVGRLLSAQSRAYAEGEVLVVTTEERRFGDARLEVGEASEWVKAIEAIGAARHA